MINILYLTTTDWGWIKQRPHFIAEGLSKYYSLTFIGLKVYNRTGHVKNDSAVKIHELFRLPFERISLIKKVNSYLYRLQLRKLLTPYDLLWFTSPIYFSFIPAEQLRNKLVIYDIMDDILEFPEKKKDKKELKQIASVESNLVQRADLIFTSASYLKEKIIQRYGVKTVHIINNALVPIKDSYENQVLPERLKKFLFSKKIKLFYIGTISTWFDINLLIKLLAANNGIEIMLFGPTDIIIPECDRLKYFGPIEHDLIFKVMQEADALIMPFQVNELIRSVNPVKLYEYIYSVNLGYRSITRVRSV